MVVEILESETIEMLREMLGDEFDSLVHTFLSDAAIRVEVMVRAMDEQAVSELEQSAHTLKGSSANMGALALSAACAQVVKQCQQRALQDIVDEVAQIQQQLQALKPILQDYANL